LVRDTKSLLRRFPQDCAKVNSAHSLRDKNGERTGSEQPPTLPGKRQAIPGEHCCVPNQASVSDSSDSTCSAPGFPTAQSTCSFTSRILQASASPHPSLRLCGPTRYLFLTAEGRRIPSRVSAEAFSYCPRIIQRLPKLRCKPSLSVAANMPILFTKLRTPGLTAS
jgi:hypothetical protein